MKKAELQNRIKELEIALNIQKSNKVSAHSDVLDSIENSADRFLKLANCLPAFIAYVNINTLQYEFVNDLFVKSFGIPKEKILGNHIKNVIGETNFKFALKYINDVKAGKSATYENTFDLASGKKWIQVNYSPIFDDSRNVVGIALVSYDITERKQVETAILESEERFQLLFNKAPLGYQSLDKEGCFIDVNQAWVDTLGYSRDEVIGKWFGDFLSPEYHDGFRKRFQTFKSQGKIHSEFEMLHKDGHKLFIAFEGKIGHDLKGEFAQTHCILQDISKSKSAQEEVIRQKELLQKVIDNIPVMITYFDQNGKILLTNQELVKVLGWTSDEWETENIFEKCYPEPEYRKEVLDYMSSGIAAWKESKTYTKHGAIVDTTWTNIKLSEGVTLGIGLDITERKQTEEVLRQHSIFNSTLLQTIPFGMDIVDEKGTILFQSDKFEILFGNNAIGKKCWELYRDDKKQCRDCPLFRGIVIGQTENYESHGVLGNKIFEISHTGMMFQGKKAMLEIFYDITERKQIENRLIRSEAELKKAQQITHIGSWYMDVSTNEVMWTEELYKMYGFNPSLPPPPFTEHMKLFTPESWEILSSSLAETSKTGIPYELELHTIRKDRSNGWMWVRGEAITDSNGNIVGLWGAAQDISERKEREEILKASLEKAKESERLKSAFLANMSHEIRTPMNGILGFTELLKEPDLSTFEQQNYIKTIQISGERMLTTVNNIVDISKIEAGLVSVFIGEININKKIESLYNFFKPEIEKKGLQFFYSYGLSSEEAVIKTDSEKVDGVLTNLVRNALKFTLDGSIKFGYEKKGAFLEFYVKDTGIGISDNQKEMIFERFRQGSIELSRKYEGSGLGLSISKSYIEMLGGKIWIESQEGKGSTFYFTIPYEPTVKEKTEIKNVDTSTIKKIDYQNLKILIVEDDEVSFYLLQKTIQTIGKEVLHAENGVEAIEACRNNPDLDLVLMDIKMPIMDGFEATRQIRQFNKGITIIAQTAFAFVENYQKAIDAGCNDYITKPISLAKLIELIRKNVHK